MNRISTPICPQVSGWSRPLKLRPDRPTTNLEDDIALTGKPRACRACLQGDIRLADDGSKRDRSAYREQLERGFSSLRFVEPLEQDFRDVDTRTGINQLRVVLTIGLVFGLIFPVWDYFLAGPGFSHYTIPLRAAITQPVLLMMIVATFFERGQRILTPLGVMAGLAPGFASLFLSSMAAEHGIGSSSIGFVMHVFFVYFFLGLRFRPAILTTGAVFFGFFAVGLTDSTSGTTLLYNGLFLTFANTIGAVGLYNLEYNKRLGFLEGRELEYLATRDALTGLANRKAFDEHRRLAWAHCKREQIPLAVALLDVDHFKAYNDTYGHQAGDRCLIAVAQTIAEFPRRPLDMVARYGGEEFVVLLPGCSARDATVLLDDLRSQIAALKLEHTGSPTSPVVSVSAGVAAVEPHATDRSVDGVLQSADTALYEAKSGGRNRVVVADAADVDAMKTGVFRTEDLVRSAAGG
jgi:diguanylate cyclase (GGDEF)-like protein